MFRRNFHFKQFYPKFETETSTATHESQQQDLVDQKIEKVKVFFVEENLLQQIRECEVIPQQKQNKKVYQNFVRFARKYISAPPHSVYYKKNLF